MNRLGSFKVKLVVWFALLALIPTAVAFYGYARLAQRSETRRADAALEGDLRTGVAGYAARLDDAATEAEQLASTRAVQSALRRHDRAALVRALHGHPHAGAVAAGLHLGPLPGHAATRSVRVVSGGRTLGRVVVAVPLDRRLLTQLSAGLPRHDRLIAIPGGTPLVPGVAAVIRFDGVRYRALESAPLSGPHGLRLAALTPQHAIDAASRSSLLRLASALAAALLLLAAATYLLGRSIASNLGRLAAAAQGLAQGRLDQRVDVRGRDEFARLGTAFNQMAEQLQVRLDELELARARTRAANARFGATLAATLDPAELLRTVAAAAVEATDAAGGVVVRPGEEPATAGDPDPQGQRIVFPLRAGEADFGSLVLTGPGFTEEHIETVAALASQAVVALENARLHRIVQGQALKDGLTGLANRRSVEETLHAEIARAQRFGDTVCLVLADLDDFKSVNDRHGHPAGDDALRLFAETLAGTVREIDVAARWGGEEFALVLPGTDAAGGARLAERARETLESRPLITDGETVTLTASFGVAALPPAHDLEELVAAADAALYEAKRTGKNRVMV